MAYKMKVSILRPPIGIGGAEMSLTEMAVSLLRMNYDVWMHFDDGHNSTFDSFNKFGALKSRCSDDAKIFFHERSFDEEWAIKNLKHTDVAIVIHRHLFSKRLSDAVERVKKKIVYCPGKNEHHIYGFTKNTLQFGRNIVPDYFIFNSSHTLNLHLNKHYPESLKQKFMYIHPPMDLEHYGNYDISTLNKIGSNFVDKTTFNVGIFGRIIPSKRPNAVLDIAYKAKRDGLNIKFNFIGGGTLEEKVRQEIIKKDLKDYVVVHGMQDDPFGYICNMDCILHMCNHESLSRAIRESIFFKVPIVAFKGAGNLELLTGSAADFLFENEEEAYEMVCELYRKDTCKYDVNQVRDTMLNMEQQSLLDLANIIDTGDASSGGSR